MNATFSFASVVMLAALAAVPFVLWRVSARWNRWLRVAMRLFSAAFALFVFWVVVVNTLFFLGVDH
jgi:hypothetical protein